MKKGKGVSQTLGICPVGQVDLFFDPLAMKIAVGKSIDGKNVGLAPLDLDIIEGQHALEIKKNGFKDFSTEIAVKAREKRIEFLIMRSFFFELKYLKPVYF